MSKTCWATVGITTLSLLAHAASAERISCVIEPRQTVNLSTSVEGVIAEINVERGQTVKKGQVIARLESEVEESSIALARERAGNTSTILSARAQIDLLTSKLNRAKKMNTKKHTSDADLEEISTELRVSRHQLNEAQHQKRVSELELAYAEKVLAQRVIYSPIDGVVVEKLMSPGEYRNEQSHIVTLAEIDPLSVEMFVPIELYGKVSVGDMIDVVPEQPFDGSYQAKVRIVDKVFDAASATFGVRLTLANPDHRLPAGIKCEAAIGE